MHCKGLAVFTVAGLLELLLVQELDQFDDFCLSSVLAECGDVSHWRVTSH